MAIYSLTPTEKDDLVSLKEALTLFAEAGHPVSDSTVRRWIVERGIEVDRFMGKGYMSYSDLLVAHRDWLKARNS